jgi:plasmid stability protein
MATLTIRNIPARVVRSLKALAGRNHRSMEQEVRELIADHTSERSSVLEQIEARWKKQKRRPTSRQIEEWIRAGRE